MLKITNRVHALPVKIVLGGVFPGAFVAGSFDMPLFRLSVTNLLLLGNVFIILDDETADIVLGGTTADIYFSHHGPLCFPAHKEITVDNDRAGNNGSVIITGYTYYEEA